MSIYDALRRWAPYGTCTSCARLRPVGDMWTCRSDWCVEDIYFWWGLYNDEGICSGYKRFS